MNTPLDFGMPVGSATVDVADARAIPLPDNHADVVITSPPYWGLRSYTDNGEHYSGQIGSEPTPQMFLNELMSCMIEMVRVTKPSGSIFVNLGDKYSDRAGPPGAGSSDNRLARADRPTRMSGTSMAPRKSLMLLPQRFAIRCIDELGLTLRAEIIWSKPNGIPESQRDRAGRTHEQWWHFTLGEKYFASIDEIRVPHTGGSNPGRKDGTPSGWPNRVVAADQRGGVHGATSALFDPRGRIPGSVWTIPSQRVVIPETVMDKDEHFATYPTDWPKRLIQGWCPIGFCPVCEAPVRPITEKDVHTYRDSTSTGRPKKQSNTSGGQGFNSPGYPQTTTVTTITGYACTCEDNTAWNNPNSQLIPAVVVDPFGGLGTTALVAKALGRHGYSFDASHAYTRAAQWRVNDRDSLAGVLNVPKAEPDTTPTREQPSLFDTMEGNP